MLAMGGHEGTSLLRQQHSSRPDQHFVGDEPPRFDAESGHGHRNLHFSIDPLEISDFKRTALHSTLMCRGRDTNKISCVASHQITPCVPMKKTWKASLAASTMCVASHRTVPCYLHAGDKQLRKLGHATCVALCLHEGHRLVEMAHSAMCVGSHFAGP